MIAQIPLAVDPLFTAGVGLEEVLIVIVKVVIAFALLLVSVMLVIWFERKLHADMTNRVGPNIAGPFGLFQTLADGIKLFFKEDLRPEAGDKRVFGLAPYLTLIPAFLIFTVVPVGGDFDNGDGTITIFGNTTHLQVADPPVGILFVLAMSSMAVYGIMLAGWSSGSKYPLFGSVRASAQMVSYEAALGLSLVAVLLKTGTLSTHEIVASQADGLQWNLWVTGFIPFIVFMIASTAELNRPPFDLVEAEQEIVGGFHTEYSSIRFSLFFLGEYMNVITMSGVMVTLFFGGPDGPIPFLTSIGWAWGIFWFLVKVIAFCFVFIWFRATLPRFRYDQLMDLGWKLLIPLSLGWLIALAALELARSEGWNRGLVGVICFGGLIVMGLLLNAAVNAGQRKRLAGEGVD
ncbi:MAG: NADH-quinone oxidoreductase subunit NuoH [Actinomycetota bacterium]